MIPIKSESEIARMRRACGITAKVRGALAALVAPGVATRDIEREADRMIGSFGGRSAFKGYQGFPGSICVSLNDEVVHGIPGERVIREGDIVSIDVGVEYGGFIGDCAVSVIAGAPAHPDDLRLLEATKAALEAGVKQAVEGNRLGDISNAVQRVAEGAGFSVVREFVGHGIGRKMHEEPQIPNFGPAGKGPRLKYGMILAIEPMVNRGGAEVEVMADKWTVRTVDRLPSAHFENTVLVGKVEAEVLTNPDYAGK
jgi:methionyl aminopeptidase